MIISRLMENEILGMSKWYTLEVEQPSASCVNAEKIRATSRENVSSGVCDQVRQSGFLIYRDLLES